MREICFDTETTGKSVDFGDRIVEIGALELIDHVPTGKTFHEYINPERDVPDEVVAVHGLTNEFLADKPKFYEIAQSWIDFVGDDGVFVAHNAPFDMSFLNFELKNCGFNTYDNDRVIDTLVIARKKFPGKHNSLDALCERFSVDASARTFHGALLDAQLLAEVYYKLIYGDGNQGFLLNESNFKINKAINTQKVQIINRKFTLSEAELAEHRDFLEKNIKNPLWLSDEIKENA
ncbi:MAG: DNA polymerase III subunit epsilon [Alphaproteobacteria bacterium]|nr:DNA polymerase III subunit epsilon [Alphaproteobacteria bacterium]